MKYVYTGGEFRTFRGYMFWGKRPVDILDKGTLEAIRRETDFKQYSEPSPEHFPPVIEPEPEENPQACPKCGAVFVKGLTMHIRWCRGMR